MTVAWPPNLDEPDYYLAGTGSRSLLTEPGPTLSIALARSTHRINQRLQQHGDRLTVISGMAEGWDECVAISALGLGVRLWCIIPNRSYGPYFWGRHSILGIPRLDTFNDITERAWRVTYVMEDVHHKTGIYLNGEHSNFVRNRYMVNGGPNGFTGADDFMVWNPTSKGTAHCVRTIKSAGKWSDEMILSDPPTPAKTTP